MKLGRGKFAAATAAAEALLEQADLLEARNQMPRYPSDMPSTLRRLQYREAWARCAREGWYDFLLIDQSLFQFRLDGDYRSFGFLECPLTLLSFEDFAFDKLGSDWEVMESELREEYETYLSADLAEKSVTPVRYDYEPKLYRPGVHPAGHIHFGIGNQIRVCVTKLMNPMSFCLFIIRHFYPAKWEALISGDDGKLACREVRDNLTDVPKKYFGHLDHLELQLR